MSGQQRALLVGLLLVVSAVAFESMAVTTVMPDAAADLGQLELYGWAFTATMIPMIVSTVVAGRVADVRGPFAPGVVGLAVIVAGTVVAASATSMPMLLGGRFLQGLGAGAANLALLVVTARAFSPAQRAATMTWYSAAWMLPAFVGPGLAAWLSERWSWHAAFWAVLPLLLLGGAVAMPRVRALPPAPPSNTTGVGVWDAIVVAAGAALVQLAGVWAPVAAVPAAGTVLVGLALLGWGGPRLLPVGQGAIRRSLTAVVAVRGLANGSYFGVQAFLPLALVRQHGVTLLLAGVALTVSSVGWMTGSWLQAQPWLRVRRDRIITIGTVAIAGGAAVVAGAAATGAGWIVAPIAGLTVAGVGMGLQSTSTTLAVMQLSAEDSLGHNTSALQVGEMLGIALLVGLAGTVFAALSQASPALTFAALAGVMALTATASILVSLRIGPVTNESTTVAKP